jgi:serine phosphatase RsbU (regulator of sigma subunit)/Tfp pilus assembly protein PilF
MQIQEKSFPGHATWAHLMHTCLVVLAIGCLLLLSAPLRSQSSLTGDSIIHTLSSLPDDTLKLKQYLVNADKLRSINPAASLVLANAYLNLAKKLKRPNSEAKALSLVALAYDAQGNFKKAIEYHLLALAIRKQLGNKKDQATSLASIANAYQAMDVIDKTLDYYLQAMVIFEETDNKMGIANTSIGLGLVYDSQNQYQEALKYYYKAASLFSGIQDKQGLADAYGNLAYSYFKTQKLDSALLYFNHSLNLQREIGDMYNVVHSLGGLGSVYQQLGKQPEALRYYKEALELELKIGDDHGLAICYEDLGAAYLNAHHFFEAKESFQKAIELSQKTSAFDLLTASYAGLAEVESNLKNYQSAYFFQVRHDRLKDSIEGLVRSKQIADMQTKYEMEKKDKELILKDAQIRRQEADNRQKSLQRNGFIIGFGLMILLALFIYRSFHLKKTANVIITAQKILVEEQKHKVEKQKEMLEEKQKEIVDSLQYARRIQRAVITSDRYISKHLDNYFILYKPKDIVSGDFYWSLEIHGKLYIVTADCTGHGVPGAFMSLLNISILNEVVMEKHIYSPELILNEARLQIIKALNSEGQEETKDGMDCTVFCFDFSNLHLAYASANNRFNIVRNGVLITSEADKMPVGKAPGDEKSFTLHTLPLLKGDLLYTFTDGYADQFGGPKGKKFKYKQLEECFLEICSLSLSEQKKILDSRMEAWKGPHEQVDDILVMGIRI